MLDIHHIATGRGNSALAIFPDGTSLLVDAGAAEGDVNAMAAARPDDSRRPGEWIARYVRRALAPTGRIRLDHVLLTHLHGDHSAGVGDVAQGLPIGVLIDRGYPHYELPQRDIPIDRYGTAYIAFTAQFAARGGRIERFAPGSAGQITERYRRSADLRVRGLAANGIVWRRGDNGSQPTFDPDDPARPTENMCSAAIRIDYGRFSYYTGGDLTNRAYGPLGAWRDIEGTVAETCGQVDVATANHHGYYDACGARYVNALQPRAVIIQAWHVTHPALSTLDTLTNRAMLQRSRDIFITNSTPANRLTNERFASSIESTDGHVVVRVDPGGARYFIDLVDNGDENDTLIRRFGPYTSGT